jgi:hypothetical protein
MMTNIAVQPNASETACENGCGPTLIAKRRSVVAERAEVQSPHRGVRPRFGLEEGWC